MKVEPQESMELIHLAELIGDIPVAMLTTIDGNSSLSSRPMSALQMDSDGAIWFFTDLRSEKVEHLRVVNLTFTDHGRSTYVSITGRGEIHAEHAHIKDLWTPFARPWFPDGPDSSNLALLKFVPDSAEYWDAPNSKMIRMFAMAASVVASKPIGLGEHETLTALSS